VQTALGPLRCTVPAMDTCLHCKAPAARYTVRFIDAAERQPRESVRLLCDWHAAQYQLLQERWQGVLLSIEPSF
jgi:hypothetical protein